MHRLRSWALAACAAAAVIVSAACGSSTGLSSGPAGNWHVTVSNVVAAGGSDTFMVRPSPFTLTVTDSSGTFTATFPTVDGLTLSGDTIYRFAPSAFSISGDTLSLTAGEFGSACWFQLGGTISGTSASGSAAFEGMCGPTTSGSWTATKF